MDTQLPRRETIMTQHIAGQGRPARPTVAKVAAELAELRQEFDGAKHHLDRIRAARGITGAHSKCEILRKQVEQLEARFLNAQQTADDVDDPRFSAINAELGRLSDRIGSFYQDLAGQVAMLNERVDNHEDQLDELRQHPNHGVDITKTTVSSDAKVTETNGWLSALIVGAVAWLLFYMSAGPLKYKWAENWHDHPVVAGLIVGAAAFLVTLGLTSRISVSVASRLNLARYHRPEPQAVEPEQPVFEDDTPEVKTKEPEHDPHTTVMPAASEDSQEPKRVTA